MPEIVAWTSIVEASRGRREAAVAVVDVAEAIVVGATIVVPLAVSEILSGASRVEASCGRGSGGRRTSGWEGCAVARVVA